VNDIECVTLNAMSDTNDSVLTVRLSSRDRALLEKLVEKDRAELADRGVEVSLATVMRQMIRQTARARGVAADDAEVKASKAAAKHRTPPPKDISQDDVRKLLVKALDAGKVTGAGLAKKCGVHPAQLSRFKKGKEAFPSAKISELLALLKSA
jgi:hypothetical protein